MTRVQCVAIACRPLAWGACLAFLGACDSSPTRPGQDARRCQQTYEFGNYGCADVTGQVVGSAGQPLAGIRVVPRYPPDRDGLVSGYPMTEADGRFRLRITRMYLPPVAGPDTVSLYIRASDPGRDSVLIQVTLAPVGAVAPVTDVVIRLPTP